MPEPFTVKSRIKSFSYAVQGVSYLLRSQHNAWIHLLATVIVIALSWYFSLSRWEWSVLILAIAGVWTAEALNTSLECLADACHPEQHPLIKRAKDVAAAAVLLFSLAAMLIGIIVFWPYMLELVA